MRPDRPDSSKRPQPAVSIEVRKDQRITLLDGQEVTLGARAFDVLVCLIENA
jgi:DNA-binding winged helix-turn-helix (wHTH) protein